MKVTGGTLILLEKKSKYRCTKWQLRIHTGLNPRTGKYSTRNRNFKGTYREAIEAHAVFRREVLRETRTERVELTFEELCHEYIKHKLDLEIITNVTAKKQLGHLALFIRHLGKASIYKITPYMITNAIKALKAGDTPSGKKASGTYIAKGITLSRAAYDYAIKEHYLSFNPFHEVDTPKKDTKEKKALSEKQIADLLALPLDRRQHIAIFLSLLAGLRRGEVSALKWGNIDFEKAYIVVAKSMTIDGQLKEPKSLASADVVPLSKTLEEILESWKECQCEAMQELGVIQGQDTFVVANRFGEPLKPGQITRWWDNNRKSLGLSGVSFHQLRHTFITLLARQKTHPAIMQRLARHSTSAVTLGIYTHVNIDQERDAISELDRQFANKIRT